MKKEINVSSNEIFKVEVPNEYSKFKIEQYGYAGTWIMETESKELNHWKVKIPNGKYIILDKIEVKKKCFLNLLKI